MPYGTMIVNNEVQRMWRGRDQFSGIINELSWKHETHKTPVRTGDSNLVPSGYELGVITTEEGL
jgi:hypothetical protein